MKLEQLQFIETTHSTNVTLRENASLTLQDWDKDSHFYGIYTLEQTQGKGLGSNRWLSQRGQNILISFLFQPPITIQNQFYFNQYFAIAIRHFLSSFIENPLIKWPNDIYVGNKKIAGILIEHSIQGDRLKYSVAGVGININQTTFDPEIPNPTSLRLLTGQEYKITDLILELVKSLNETYHLILNQEFSELEQEYLNHLFQYQTTARYLIQEQEIIGTIVGLSPIGQLLIQSETGELHTCNYKEVKFLISEL